MAELHWDRVRDLFHRALDLPPNERALFLNAQCIDAGIRAEVQSLLADENSGLLDSPAVAGLREAIEAAISDHSAAGNDSSASTQALSPETEGTLIGRYRLLERIGEGGMGEVWLAEQQEPVRRRVALKLVKPGMNTHEVMARFESERQALALMDHPAIAKVFDAGSTPQGAPYFVLEYVAGVPITAFCDNHRLGTRERLELFIHVCEGVQHAHQKAIIHRDLKPSNILVTKVDGRPAPKIIDFGVAKALSQRLTEQTLYTLAGMLVGTPPYMSPEQAQSSGEDIDTRTDVYSLGVILYELLTGAPPLELRKIAFHEFARRLWEEEPRKPSTKVRTHDPATSTEVARNRRTEPMTLVRQLRGDLDCIVLKALEKDRARRYGSPTDFAADIERSLKNEAVLAVPPSVAYRARKAARRYRGALVAAGAFGLLLILAAVISIGQSIRANREAAVSQAVNNFLQNDLLAQASAANQSEVAAQPDPHLEVRTALDRAAARIQGKFDNEPEVEAAIRDTMGQTYIDLGLYPEAGTQFERALDLYRRALGAENAKTLIAMSRLGTADGLQGKYAKAEALVGEALAIQRRVLGPEHADTLASLGGLATLRYYEGKYGQVEALDRQILEIRRRVLGPEHADTLASMNALAVVLEDDGQYSQAESLQKRVLETRRRVLGPEHPSTLSSMMNLATVYNDEGQYAHAEVFFNQTLETARQALGPEHPWTLWSMDGLAVVYGNEDKYVQAEALFNQTLEIARRVLRSENPYILLFLSDSAFMYQREGKYDAAETCAAQVLAGRRHALGPDSPNTMASAGDLALAYVSQGKFVESEFLAREALETDKKVQPNNWQRYRAASLLGASLAGEERYAEAEPLLIEGYRGMMERKQLMGVPDRYHLDLGHKWLIELYKSWGRPPKAGE